MNKKLINYVVMEKDSGFVSSKSLFRSEDIVAATIAKSQEINLRVITDTMRKMPKFNGKIECISNNIPSNYMDDTDYYKGIPVVDNCVYVKHFDPLVVYNTMRLKGFKTLLCYNTCNTNRGANVKTGSLHIEAEICRRSNLFGALSRIDRANYPLNTGTLLAFQDITVFKTSNYKYLKKEETFKANMLGSVFLKSPGSMYVDDQECYELDAQRQKTRKTLSEIVKYANREGYQSVIFHQLGVETNSIHPIDEFIELLKEALQHLNAEHIFVLVPRGMSKGDLVFQREIFIKFCRNVDNINPDNHSDCEIEKETESALLVDTQTIHQRKKHIRKVFEDTDGKIHTAKDLAIKVTDDSSEDEYDDAKSIHYLPKTEIDFAINEE